MRVQSFTAAGALALVIGGLPLAGTADAGGGNEVRFAYTGAEQTWTVPDDVCQVMVDAAGASGGENPGIAPGGLGGTANALIDVTPGETLHAYVGGVGGSQDGSAAAGAGGFNGGADGGQGSTGIGAGGGGGGDASDVRQGDNTLTERVVVAGGGGGAGGLGWPDPPTDGAGGNGGGAAGDAGYNGNYTTGGGGGTGVAGGTGGLASDGAQSGSNGQSGLGGTAGEGPGYIGGGGGGGAVQTGRQDAGGGGGGSGFGPAGVVFGTEAEPGDGWIDLAWTVQPGCDTPPTTTTSTTVAPTTTTTTTTAAARPQALTPTFTG